MKETTLLTWQRDSTFLPGWRVRFLSTGRAEIERRALEQSLATFVETVLTRLDEEHLHQTALASEWQALQELDAEELDFCMAAARLGLDPFATPAEVVELIIESAADLSPALLDDFLDAATPARLRDEAEWVQAHWRDILDSDRTTEPLPVLSNGYTELKGRPWERGLQDARAFRRAVSVSATETVDVSQWVAVNRVARVSRRLQGLGAKTSAHGRLVALAEPKTDEGERFAAARALWRFVNQAEASEFLVTAARTPKQQAERAFAAELLAPASGVAEMLGPDTLDPISTEEVRPISQHFAVSDWVIQYQITNQLLDFEVEDLTVRRDD